MALTTTEESKLRKIIEAFEGGKRISDLPDVSGTDPANILCEVLDEDGESKKASLATLLSNIGSAVLDLGEFSGVAAFATALGTAEVIRSGKSIVVGRSTTSDGYESLYLCIQSINANSGTGRQYIFANNNSSTDDVNGWRVRSINGVKSGSYTLGSWEATMPHRFWLNSNRYLEVGDYRQGGSGTGAVATVDLAGIFTAFSVSNRTAGANTLTATIAGLERSFQLVIATTSYAGLMSATDKTKLDGIAEGADKTSVTRLITEGTAIAIINDTTLYVPTASGSGSVLGFEISSTMTVVDFSIKTSESDYMSVRLRGATTESAGAMTAADKTTLDELSELRQNLPAVVSFDGVDTSEASNLNPTQGAPVPVFYDTYEAVTAQEYDGDPCMFTPTRVYWCTTVKETDNTGTVYGQHRFFLIGTLAVPHTSEGTSRFTVAVKTWEDGDVPGYLGSWAYNEDDDANGYARKGVLFQATDGTLYYRAYGSDSVLTELVLPSESITTDEIDEITNN